MSKINNRITSDDKEKYLNKLIAFSEANDNDKKVMISKDPSIFAYALFKDATGNRFKLYTFQDLIINDSSRYIAVACSRQVGKEQPYSAKVVTPTGFKLMGDIKIGDLVISEDGNATCVTNIFEQEEKDVYEIEFTDGSKTHCGLEHLWKVRGSGAKNWKVLSLKQIIKERGLNPTSDNAYRIPNTSPVNFKEQKHTISPYVLGALLGDGGFTSNNITFSNPEEEIISKINSLINKEDVLSKKQTQDIDYIIKRKIRNNTKCETYKHLEEFNLIGKYSYNKHIPKEYIYDSVENRIELLRGLMDTDGYIDHKCSMEYSTTSIELAKGVKEIVQSLGGKCHWKTRMGRYSKNGEIIYTRINYRVYIKIKNINPFSLKRKAALFYNTKYSQDKVFKKIELVRRENSRCIMVYNKNHTYLTDDYIVTHNSSLSVIKALHYILNNDNATVLVISKTLTQSKELISKLKQLVNNSPYKKELNELADGYDNKSEFYIKNKGKDTYSRIISVPATDSARGYSANLVIADEIAFWDNSIEMFNEAIKPTVSHTKGSIMMLSTPKGKIGVFYDAFTKPDIWSCYQYAWNVCPIHTEETMAMERADIGEFRFRQEYEASFVANQSAFFKQEHVNNAIDRNKENGGFINKPVVIGVDFGKKNDNTIITIGYIKNIEDDFKEQVIQIHEIIEKPLGTDYAKIVGEIKALTRKYDVQNIIYDQTGVGEGPGDFMKDAGLPVEGFIFSLQSKVNIYSNFNLLLEENKVKLLNNKKLIDEMLLFEYEYTLSGNMKLHHPEGGHDDHVDSACLCVYGLKRPNKGRVSVTVVEQLEEEKQQENNEEDNIPEEYREMWEAMGIIEKKENKETK